MTYKLIFKLTKYKSEKPFSTVVDCSEDELAGVKEERAMHFEKLYKTPVRCVKVELMKRR